LEGLIEAGQEGFSRCLFLHLGVHHSLCRQGIDMALCFRGVLQRRLGGTDGNPVVPVFGLSKLPIKYSN